MGMKEVMVSLANEVRERQFAVAKTRADFRKAELEAWQTIDFSAEGIKLAKQKELRVKVEVEKEFLAYKAAQAEYGFAERNFNIKYSEYTAEIHGKGD